MSERRFKLGPLAQIGIILVSLLVMLGVAALMALSDAVASCGDGSVYPALDAPATPERVLSAVLRVEAGRRS